jgi:hypothetical protein
MPPDRDRLGSERRLLGCCLALLLVAPADLLPQAGRLIRVGVAAQHLADTTVKLDPGIALVTPRVGQGRDSLALFRSNTESVTWGWFVRDLTGQDSLPFALRTPLRLRPNIMEFSYEESGLPVDSILPDRVRVLLGWDGEQRMRRAWVQLDSTVELRTWPEWLAQQTVFFRPGVRPEFHLAPGGSRYPVPLSGGDDPDYIMHAKQVQGEWMQVELVTPSDYCADADTIRYRRETVWIRFLDANRRPRVWYYTRGC